MTEPILNSSQAVAILHQISLSKEGSYTKEIAEEIDKPQKSVNRLLQSLLEKGLIKKGKRTKAQYYTLNPEGIAQYWISQIENHYEALDAERKQDVEKRYKIFEENRNEIENFLKKYFSMLLQNYSPNLDATLQDILFETLSKTIMEMEQISPEELEENKFLRVIPLLVSDYKGTYSNVLTASYALGSDVTFEGWVQHVEDEENQ